MKIFKYALLAIPFLYFSCSDDDDNSIPDEINDEEVITTMNVYVDGVLAMSSTDDDGPEGPNQPVVTAGVLQSFTTHEVRLEFLNELEDPAEDITVEIEEESDEHQVFFSHTIDSDIEFVYTNFDNQDPPLPLGTTFNITTGEPGSGTITITLIHEPDKPNTGLESAGGTQDIQVTFDVNIAI